MDYAYRKRGGDGENGVPNSITGQEVYYAGGGAGGTNTNAASTPNTPTGDLGGGGNGNLQRDIAGVAGTDGLGGGGGGGDAEMQIISTKGCSGVVSLSSGIHPVSLLQLTCQYPIQSYAQVSIEEERWF